MFIDYKAKGIANRKKYKIIDGEEFKHCSKCDNFLSKDSFRFYAKAWDKLDPYCKFCRKSLAEKNRAKRANKNKDYFKNYYELNKEKVKKKALINSQKYREKNRENIAAAARKDYHRRHESCENIWKLTPSEIYKFSGFVLVETSDDCVLPRGK